MSDLNGKLYEDEFEQAFCELLEQQGWTHTFGCMQHRKFDETILEEDMHTYLEGRYPELEEDDIQSIIANIRNIGGDTDYGNGRTAFYLYRDGYNYQFADSSKPALHIDYIDYENPDPIAANIFRVVNQFEFDEGKNLRIPDIMLFINGIPVGIIELKNPTDEQATIDDAYDQITIRYRRDCPSLLKYCAISVISDGSNTTMGSIYSPQEFYYAWKKVNNEDNPSRMFAEVETLVKGALAPDRILSVLHDFTYFPDQSEEENKEIEIVCRYPQFFATNKLAAHILSVYDKEQNEKRKGGYFFGATGCGKTYIMLFLARQLQQRYKSQLGSPTVIIIVDREDLEDQSIKLFAKSTKYLVDNNVRVFDSRSDLENELRERKTGGVYITTIQKFTKETGLLSDRPNIICFSDEAHRTQNNTGSKMRINTDKEKGETGAFITFGFAKYLRDALPNATYVGFTGTPIDEVVHVFGEEVDRYTMRQSKEDGITVDIMYEGRISHALLDSKKIKEIEEYYKACAEEGASEAEIEKSKRAMSNMNKILGDPERLERLADDIVKHYEARVADNTEQLQKAMIVCSERKIAYELYKKIAAIRPEWTEKKKTIDDSKYTKEQLENLNEVAFLNLIATRENDDEPKMHALLGDKGYRKQLADDFKNDDSNFHIAIVVDMWITGFDCPSLTVLYNDKPLQKHTLIQTISRVNRRFPGKEVGLIVDYIGIRHNMLQAMKQYGGDSGGNDNDIEMARGILLNELKSLDEIMQGFSLAPFLTSDKPIERMQCLQKAAEFILSIPKKEGDKMTRATLFHGHVRRLTGAYNICHPAGVLNDAETALSQCYMGISSFIRKMTSDGKTAAVMNKAVERMVSEALQFNGVQTILTANSEEDLFGEGMMREIEDVKLPHTRFQLLVKLLKKAIKEYQRTNKLKAKQFEEMLNATLEEYNNRKAKIVNDTVSGVVGAVGDLVEDKVSELTEQIKKIFENLKKDREQFKALGITFEEKAFYDILVDIRDKNDFTYPEEKCKMLARKIKEMIDDNSLYADWMNNGNLRSTLESNLLVLLYNNGYPPQWNKAIFERVLDQVENYKKYESLSPVDNDINASLPEEDEPTTSKVIPLYDEYREGCIPLYTLRAACGYFEDGEKPEQEGWIDATGHGFTPDRDRHFVVHAKGDSMQPRIKDGDYCVFEWYKAGSREGEIVLTQSSELDPDYDGKYTIKKYHSEKVEAEEGWKHSKVELIPLNKDYNTIVLDSDGDYRTVGILKAVIHTS